MPYSGLTMKILYGVVGEGMGHAIRSRVVVEHLLAEGHEVELIASSRAVDFLRARFDEVHEIHGFHIVSEDNRVRKGKTLWSNVLSGTASLPQQIASYFELIEDFAPEAVISDFESWSYLYAKAHRLPVFSVDNQQVINRCTHTADVLVGQRANFELVRAFVKSKVPFCDHYLVTTFFRPPVRKDKTSLLPPILRPEILAAQRLEGDHLLVYQTAEGNQSLLRALRETGTPCRIYGMRRGLSQEQVEGNLRFQPFSEAGFVADLASARAVVASAGFTLMSECVYLHKPMLAIPLEGQFEQIINGRYLEREGYGRLAAQVSPQEIQGFIEAIPDFVRALSGYQQDGNQALFEALDSHLDQAAAGLY